MLLRPSCSARAHRRSSSSRLGHHRVDSLLGARGHYERQVGRERRPGAACGLDSYVSPLPPQHTSPPLPPTTLTATLFMIASEFEASSRFPTT
ncbi:unnamed protein product [Danaus chrysippus]|uniref:(African queen) hypothetical protein n=1 Tax=Danaus chrysippus TaxID=151541 RepID=A0A8J2RBR4_9NEOP|nr:unnamed protein product [Danaus chrysippus]